MSFSLKRFGAAGLASVFLTASMADFAQAQGKKPAQPAQTQPAPAAPAPSQAAPRSSRPQGPVKIQLVPTQNDWTKVCAGSGCQQGICSTFRDFSTQAGQPPAMALSITEIKGRDTAPAHAAAGWPFVAARASVFTSTRGRCRRGTSEICFPNGCFAEAISRRRRSTSSRRGRL